MALQVAAHEAVLTGANFQSRGARLVDAGGAVFLGQRQHAQNAAHRGLTVLPMHAAAQRADLFTSVVGTVQQLLRAHRRMLGPVLLLDAMSAARLTQVLAQ